MFFNITYNKKKNIYIFQHFTQSIKSSIATYSLEISDLDSV